MINKASVINSIANNGGDVSVVDGAINVTGLDPIPVSGLASGGVVRIAPNAEQRQKSQLTFTASNSATYEFSITGYNMQYGNEVTQVISFTSAASASLTSVSLQAITAINSLSGFSVTATNASGGVTGDASGIVVLTGATASPLAGQLVGPVFSVQNTDTKISVAAALTVTFSAAPTGGRTATGYVVVPDSGTLTTGINGSIKIIDGGEGYLAAPTLTFAGGGGGTSAAGTVLISEGRVVGVNTTGGTGYVTRIGLVEVGTPRAIKLKYGYASNNLNNPSTNALSSLGTLVDGNNYSEWIFTYAGVATGGVGIAPSTVATIQQALFVNQADTTVTTSGSCANLLTLDSYWGALSQIQQGYKVNILDSGASNTCDAVNASTGAFTLVAGGSPALGAVSLGIKPMDIIVVGTGAIISAAATGVFPISVVTNNTTGFAQFGITTISVAVSSATVYKAVLRRPLNY